MKTVIGLMIAIILLSLAAVAYQSGMQAVAECIATHDPGQLCRTYNDSAHIVPMGAVIAAVVVIALSWPSSNQS